MAELTSKERLQPSLLDRLTDNERDQTQESRERRVLSPARLRESVRRDLSWLFNSINLASAQSLDEFPFVAQSVLNYGLPALAGMTASSVDIHTLEQTLREILWRFEPRLLRDSITVRSADDKAQGVYNQLAFYIDAMLWAQPLPLRLFLRTDVDLEVGVVRVTDLGG